MVALLVALIPTTIGALLSAVGIADIDRTLRLNVLAMSGKPVEAAGDVRTLILDKTGTITMGNRQATEFIPLQGVSAKSPVQGAYLASCFDSTPEGRTIVAFAESLEPSLWRCWTVRGIWNFRQKPHERSGHAGRANHPQGSGHCRGESRCCQGSGQPYRSRFKHTAKMNGNRSV